MSYVDLFLIHHPVSMRAPADDEAEGAGPAVVVKKDLVAMDMEGVWEEMEECHRRGLARAIGVSNFSSKKLADLLAVARVRPAVDQVECHPVWRQGRLRAFCASQGIHLSVRAVS